MRASPKRRGRSVVLLLVGAAFILAASPGSAAAEKFVVKKTDDGGKRSLRGAVQKANDRPSDDIIVLRPRLGTKKLYELSRCGPDDSQEDLNANGDLDYTDVAKLVIKGKGATIRNTCVGERVLHNVEAGTLKLAKVTLKKGDSDGNGGAITSATGPLILTKSSIVRNRAEFAGGGIHVFNGATIRNSAIARNRAGSGGGIHKSFGTLAISGSLISANRGGGGINHAFGLTTIDSSAISGNEDGPGLHKAFDALTVTNSTISGNTGGPAISHSFDSTTLANTTVTGNGAGVSMAFDDFTLRNSIVAGNGGAQCSGPIASAGHNLASDASCGLTGTGDLPSTNPKLAPLADNGGPTPTHALRKGSPAINAGNPAAPGSGPPACEKFDQRGERRTNRCDIGAYER